jgi:hypothetical protein
VEFDTYGELHARLLGGDEGKNVVFCSSKDTFQDSQIGYDTASVEVFGSMKDEVIALISNGEIVVAGVHSS